MHHENLNKQSNRHTTFQKKADISSGKLSPTMCGYPGEGLAVPSRVNKRTIFSEFQCELLKRSSSLNI